MNFRIVAVVHLSLEGYIPDIKPDMDLVSYTEGLPRYAEIPKGTPRSTWVAVMEWIFKGIPLESISGFQSIWPIEENREGKIWSRQGKIYISEEFRD